MLKNILIFAVAGVIAILSAINSYAAFAKRKQPDVSLSVPVFFNGLAAETLASSILKKNIADNENQFPDIIDTELTSLAKSSFLSEPTATEAVAVLAFSKQAQARKSLMEQAYSLSRREQLVVGWLIASSSENNDLDALLKYYDISIRTNRNSSNLLLPVMANALANEGFIAPIRSLLTEKPPWARRFWQYASINNSSVKNVAVLREQILDLGVDEEIYSDDKLILNLTKNYMFDEAKQLRNRLVANGKANINAESQEAVVNGSFSSKPLYPPINWQTYSNGEYGASFSDNGLYLSAINNSGGKFARQLIYLSPQIYQVKVDVSKAISPDDNLSLQLACAEKEGQKLNKIVIDIRDKKVDQSVNYTEGSCRYFWLNINGLASENGLGFDNVIKSISIKGLGA